MCSIIAFLLLVVSGFLGYSMAAQTSVATPEPQIMVATAEVAPIPTQAIACATQDVPQDLTEMSAVVDASIFAQSLWTIQSDFSDERTTTTWRADSLGAVAYLEYLHFDCGVLPDQIDQYFSPETFDTVLSTYSSHEQTAVCRQNGLRLFEFDLSFNDTRYQMRYWIKRITPTRVADFALTFPADQQAKMAEYAGRLFPTLPTCAAAAG
ncbi:MAG: hypothetical protein ABI700_16205 [Chloroflexota bacterium]